MVYFNYRSLYLYKRNFFQGIIFYYQLFLNMKFFYSLSALCAVFFLSLLTQCSPGNRSDEGNSAGDTSNQVSKLFEQDEWTPPDTSTLPKDDSGNLIRY